jgi:hypothetical protein
MTHFLAINDNHHGRAVTRIISLSASVAAAARVAVPFALTWQKRVTANRYVRLVALSVIMILATMGLIGISFDLLSINHRINCSIGANY